jgi:gamma-glutamyltranspeptidase/glutathione hydrolase
VALIEALNILEPHALQDFPSAIRTHVIVEAMRRAYRDRAEYLGDPDFVDVPVERLIGKAHAREVSADLMLNRATPSAALRPITPPPQGDHTTHLSVLDAQGNRVAATLSINYPFGSGFTPPGTGVLLNDEMDDFSAKANAPNGYGLVGVEANAIAPGKRPLSSMTPTFVETSDRVGILGTPGGSRIISMVLLGVLAYSEGLPPEAWVATPRFHHQYLPDEVLFEPAAFATGVQGELKALGHKLTLSDRNYGNMQAILWDREHGTVQAAADPRGEGTAEVFVVAPRRADQAQR